MGNSYSQCDFPSPNSRLNNIENINPTFCNYAYNHFYKAIKVFEIILI